MAEKRRIGAFAQRNNLARNLEPGDRRGARRGWIESLSLDHVRAIDPRERNPDQHLARTRARHRRIGQSQHFGSTGRVESRDLHSFGNNISHLQTPVARGPLLHSPSVQAC